MRRQGGKFSRRVRCSPSMSPHNTPDHLLYYSLTKPRTISYSIPSQHPGPYPSMSPHNTPDHIPPSGFLLIFHSPCGRGGG